MGNRWPNSARNRAKTAALWGSKRASAIAKELGISKPMVYRYVRELGLRPVQFLKAKTCQTCGKKWNPKLKETKAKSYSRRCPDCIAEIGQHHNIRQQELAYRLMAAGLRPRRVMEIVGYKGRQGVWQGALKFARFARLPWPIDRMRVLINLLDRGSSLAEVADFAGYENPLSLQHCIWHYKKRRRLKSRPISEKVDA